MRTFEAQVEPALASLAPLRHSLDEWLVQGGVGEPPRAAVVLATHEAVANAIEHAGTLHAVLVRGEADIRGVVIEVTDDGSWRPPADPPPEDRGRGLNLIRALVSDAHIRTDDSGTTVRIQQLVD